MVRDDVDILLGGNFNAGVLRQDDLDGLVIFAVVLFPIGVELNGTALEPDHAVVGRHHLLPGIGEVVAGIVYMFAAEAYGGALVFIVAENGIPNIRHTVEVVVEEIAVGNPAHACPRPAHIYVKQDLDICAGNSQDFAEKSTGSSRLIGRLFESRGDSLGLDMGLRFCEIAGLGKLRIYAVLVGEQDTVVEQAAGSVDIVSGDEHLAAVGEEHMPGTCGQVVQSKAFLQELIGRSFGGDLILYFPILGDILLDPAGICTGWELCGRKGDSANGKLDVRDFAVDKNGIPKLVADAFDKIPVCLGLLGEHLGDDLIFLDLEKSAVWFQHLLQDLGQHFTGVLEGPAVGCHIHFLGVGMRFDLDFAVLVQVMRADKGAGAAEDGIALVIQDTDGGVRLADTVLLRDRPSGDKKE